MSRKQRENMMDYLKKVKGLTDSKLMYMTDEDIEHIYDRTYADHEIII